MAEATPSERLLRARMGGHALHAKHDSRQLTKPARRAFLDRFERQVDPDLTLSSEERSRRADQARRSYFSSLALRSAQARRRGRSQPS